MRLAKRSLRRRVAMDSRQPPVHIRAIRFAQARKVAEFTQQASNRPQSSALEILCYGLQSHHGRYSFRKQ